jgi:hypothetical protein
MVVILLGQGPTFAKDATMGACIDNTEGMTLEEFDECLLKVETQNIKEGCEYFFPDNKDEQQRAAKLLLKSYKKLRSIQKKYAEGGDHYTHNKELELIAWAVSQHRQGTFVFWNSALEKARKSIMEYHLDKLK